MDPRLIEATGAAIARWGLAGTTLNRIADEADMSRATFYRRGVTLDQLIAALAGDATETFQVALWPALTGTGSAAQRLRAALEGSCATADDHLPLLAGIILAQDEILDRHRTGVLKTELFTEPFERLLRDGAADGTLREVQPAITATMLFNTVSWGYIRLRATHDLYAETAQRSVIDLVMHGLGTEPEIMPSSCRARCGLQAPSCRCVSPHENRIGTLRCRFIDRSRAFVLVDEARRGWVFA